MVDDIALTDKRRILIKTYKNVIPQKQTVVAEVGRDLLQKMIEKWSRKTATGLTKNYLLRTEKLPCKKKGKREREIYYYSFRD